MNESLLNHSSYSLLEFQKPLSLLCNMNQKNLVIVMDVILKECKLLAYGYHSQKNQYWGKISSSHCFFIQIQNQQIDFYYPTNPPSHPFRKIHKKIKEYLTLCDDPIPCD